MGSAWAHGATRRQQLRRCGKQLVKRLGAAESLVQPCGGVLQLQALRLVEQRVRYYLRTQHQLKAIDAGVDYREKVLIWHHAETKRSFVATGMLKKELVAEWMDFVLVALPYRYLATSSRDKGKVTARAGNAGNDLPGGPGPGRGRQNRGATGARATAGAG